MINTLLALATVLLAVSGICELIHGLRLIIISPKRISAPISVIRLKSGEAAAQIRYAVEQRKWLGPQYAQHIVAVASGISEAELAECQEIAGNNGVIICTLQMLSDVIAKA